ncbi:hypothetical protein H6P81_002723 [Aristolochia fimbriata]|uniref:Transposase n=1 Tax=Aristolochia fimbriata TaxID=158543 RepID=A0AAV7FDF4_ARIFI|nr:hypothetical protein H6P81_002723 [Aristolochia fimbriata]
MDFLADKSWMFKYPTKFSRCEQSFVDGVMFFVDYAKRNKGITGKGVMLCPCAKCENQFNQDIEVIAFHIVKDGFFRGYTTWNLHGESHKRRREENLDDVGHQREMESMLIDAFAQGNTGGPADVECEHLEASKFNEMLDEAMKPLYGGCSKYSKLSFMVHLFQLKCLHKWSNKSFSDVLGLLKDAFPPDNSLPSNWYESRKLMSDLGLNYHKIHACQNDCILFRNEYADLNKCPKCGASRWMENKNAKRGKTSSPVKVLLGTTEDGKMCHPRDSIAWNHFDAQHSAFSSDPRSVRLGLASDGFSPFKICSGSSHSTWPVVLIVYNLPPWLAMKQSFSIMSLLIDGPKSPGNDIDVYLQPLIDELHMLWGGVRTFDAEKGEYFQMRAAVMWTINDFPAYGMLSGWSTKGYTACPTCHIFHGSIYLPCSRKCVYLRHRRFLPDNHPWRVDKKSFNGEVANDQAPHALTGEQIIQQWNGYENVRFGKAPKVGVHALRDGNTLLPNGWKKKSIFFDLPYWGTLLLRHNFDVMHVEKNVCESIINTILQKDGKSKDNIKARMDLERLNIRKPLHPKPSRKKTGEFVIPHASYQMSKSEKERFLKVLKDLKLPDGFSSNISKNVRVREGKLVGLKSHDCHVLMQQLLPLALRTTVAKPVATILIEYCHFFKELCSKTVELNRLEALEQKIPIILCNLEKFFPPAFFDVMVHLTIHLATEVKVAGPVQYRWMYPIERYLLTLKNYIRNKHRPEGSIAEGYLMEEVTTFCARYVDGMETKLNRPVRYEEGPIGADSK